MTKSPYLSIIIPAYNEAERLPKTLLDVDFHLSQHAREVPSYEIIVVDNNSQDATLEIVRRFQSLINNLFVIQCSVQGKGAAVKKGMQHARGNIRIFMDADNSTTFDHFFTMQEHLHGGHDVVIASRQHPDSRLSPPQPFHKQLLGKAGNLLIQKVLLDGIRDTQCGFKAFTHRAAEKLFEDMSTEGWGFDIEILARAKKHNLKIREIPITWVNDERTSVTLSSYPKTLAELFRIKRKVKKEYGGVPQE